MRLFDFFKKKKEWRTPGLHKELEPLDVQFDLPHYDIVLRKRRRIVKKEFKHVDLLKRGWIEEFQEKGALMIGEQKKNEVIKWIESDPEKLFQFAYGQYQDFCAPLYHCSIPLLKLAGLLGHQPALLLVCSHCLSTHDLGECFFGLSLLLHLVKKGSAEAKFLLASLYYKGHEHLSIKINFGKAAHLLFEIQNEQSFVENPIALTMYGILLDTDIITLSETGYVIKYYDHRGDVLGIHYIDSDLQINSEFMINGVFKPQLLYKKALKIDKDIVPFAEIADKAASGDREATDEFADAIENGCYLKVIPENEDFIDAQIEIMNAPLIGNWKLGNLVPRTCAAARWRM